MVLKADPTQETQIAIIGAGVAGCIAAIALAPMYEVVLIDKQEQPAMRIGECLPPAARRILNELELLDALGQDHLLSQGIQSYWGSDRMQVTDHLRNPDGFGWHLNRPAFESFLRQSAEAQGVACLWPAMLEDSHDVDDQWILKVATPAGNHQIQARYVIDAGGRKAPFAWKQGPKRLHVDRLVACWATLPNQNSYAMGTIAAADDGWWYTSPVPGDKRVLAFQTDSDLVTLKTAEALAEAATKHPVMRPFVADLEFQGIVPANSSRLLQVTGPNWAALGDAATSFDPLSSQGMFNAMATAMQLVHLIKQHGIDPSSPLQQQYALQVDQIWTHYLEHKDIFYSMEARRRNGVFWERRLQKPTPSPSFPTT